MIYRLFYPMLVFKAVGMIFLILFAGIGLGPDEAQYWTWSRHLDFGYYSKPPGVAWQIFLTTALFGSTEFGVRMSAVILGTLFAWAVYRLGLQAGCSRNTASLAGMMAALTPLGFFSTFLAITDGGLLVFWTLALGELVKAKVDHQEPNYVRFGLYIACGALFKWPIYLLWLIAFIEQRSRKMITGLLISLLGLFPAVFWNATHQFATFKHVFTIVQGGNDGGSAGNPLEFIGSQAAIISPIIFILGISAFFFWKAQSKSVKFLGSVSLGIILAYVAYSFFKKGQGNWCLFAYPSLFVFIAAVFSEGKRRWLVFGGLGLSVALVLAAFMIPKMQQKILIPWKLNPFRHNVGWDALSKALEQVKTGPSFFFADKYQNSSILSFYAPGQPEAYFLNLSGARKNQFSYWPAPEAGKNGIFVAVENGTDLDKKMHNLEEHYLQALAPYFARIHAPKRVTLFRVDGKSVKEALIFYCEAFTGNMPIEPEKY